MDSTAANSSRLDLELAAMRLAEQAHRQANHFRKAPVGEDRPAYFLHLCEVAWLLRASGADAQTVAAGFLHDVIEDCGYTEQRVAEAIGDDRVAQLVAWVSEPDKGQSWQVRNAAYLEKMRTAPPEVLALSCADKTSNLNDMCRLLDKGYRLDDFLSVGASEQISKFHALGEIYATQVPAVLLQRYQAAVARLRAAVESD